MNKITKLTAALVLSGVASAAMASSNLVKTGITFNGQLGYAQNNLDSKISTAIIKKGNLAYGGGVGAQIGLPASNIALGGEVDMLYGRSIAKVTDNGSTTKVSNLLVPVMATATYETPMSASNVAFDIFVKGGVAYNNISTEKSGSNTLSVTWDNSWAPAAAAGVGVAVGNGFNVFGQYLHVFGKNEVKTGTSSKAANIDVFTAGISYSFSAFG